MTQATTDDRTASARGHLAEALRQLTGPREVRAADLVRQALILLDSSGQGGIPPDELNASNDD